jgi:demethylmenaquinone methyltransferase/2-methoxy-6-polyprenyl-1,4-benzoquinol methylase
MKELTRLKELGFTEEEISCYFKNRQSYIKQQNKAVKEVLCGEKILECGSGEGEFTKELLNILTKNQRLWSVDIDAQKVEKAREKFKDETERGRVEIIEGDINDLPFEDDFFDSVISQNAVHDFQIKSIQDAFEEIKRVLKPGGRLIIIDRVADGRQNSMEKKAEDLYHKVLSYQGIRVFGVRETKEYVLILNSLGFSNIGIKLIERKSSPVTTAILKNFFEGEMLLELAQNESQRERIKKECTQFASEMENYSFELLPIMVIWGDKR